MASYCSLADVQAFLPAGGLPNPARVATGSASGDYIESDGHALATDAEVVFRAEINGTVPGGITAGTTYYAIYLSASRFKLATAPGGSAMGLSTDGANFVYTSPLPWAAWMEWASRQVDSFLPPHVVPLIAPYAAIAVTAAGELAALRGLQATAGSAIDLGSRLDKIGEKLVRWAKSLPVRGVLKSNTSPANLAVVAAAGAGDPRGWGGLDDTRIP